MPPLPDSMADASIDLPKAVLRLAQKLTDDYFTPDLQSDEAWALETCYCIYLYHQIWKAASAPGETYYFQTHFDPIKKYPFVQKINQWIQKYHKNVFRDYMTSEKRLVVTGLLKELLEEKGEDLQSYFRSSYMEEYRSYSEMQRHDSTHNLTIVIAVMLATEREKQRVLRGIRYQMKTGTREFWERVGENVEAWTRQGRACDSMHKEQQKQQKEIWGPVYERLEQTNVVPLRIGQC